VAGSSNAGSILCYCCVEQDVTRKEVKGEKDDSDDEAERPQPNQVNI